MLQALQILQAPWASMECNHHSQHQFYRKICPESDNQLEASEAWRICELGMPVLSRMVTILTLHHTKKPT
jgi:hypothetical protein